MSEAESAGDPLATRPIEDLPRVLGLFVQQLSVSMGGDLMTPLDASAVA